MTGPVICGIAAPEATELARLAAAQAARLSVGLVLAHIGDPPEVADRPFATRHERGREEEAFDRAGLLDRILEPIEVDRDLPHHRVVEFGEPAEALRALAEEAGAALLLVGHRRIGAVDRAMLGSTSTALSRNAPCPVLVVPREAIRAKQTVSRPVLVCGIDGSADAERAALTAAHLARRLDNRLVLVRASEGAREAGVSGTVDAARAIAGDSAVEVEVREGAAAEQLAACGRERGAELLVVGSRGRGAVRAAILGSVSITLFELADRPVLVVPPEVALAGDETA